MSDWPKEVHREYLRALKERDVETERAYVLKEAILHLFETFDDHVRLEALMEFRSFVGLGYNTGEEYPNKDKAMSIVKETLSIL